MTKEIDAYICCFFFFCKNKTLKLLQEYVMIDISGGKKTFRTDRQPELQWLISHEKYADEMRFAWTAPAI